jgi:hypothetical protein
MELQLTPEELELVTRIFKNYLPNLREEVYKTENYDWRQALKQDEVVLKGLIQRLEAVQTKA